MAASPGSRAAAVSVEGTVQVQGGDKGVRLERGLSECELQLFFRLLRCSIGVPVSCRHREQVRVQQLTD